MKPPKDARGRYRAFGSSGGHTRARSLAPGRRAEIASRFADLALPGGDLVDRGLADLAAGRTTAASLLVSLAAPRLRREGVPVENTLPDPELHLYRLLASTEGDLAHTRYNAHLRLIVSFADSCTVARLASAAGATDAGRCARA